MTLLTKTALKAQVETTIRTPNTVSGKVENSPHSILEDNIIDNMVDQYQLEASKAGVTYVVPTSAVLDLNDVSYTYDPVPTDGDKALYNNYIWTYAGTTWTKGSLYVKDNNTGIDDKVDKIGVSAAQDGIIIVGKNPTKLAYTDCIKLGTKKITDLLDKLAYTGTDKPIPYITSTGQLAVSNVLTESTLTALSYPKGTVDGLMEDVAISANDLDVHSLLHPITQDPSAFQVYNVTTTSGTINTIDTRLFSEGNIVYLHFNGSVTIAHNETAGTYKGNFIFSNGQDYITGDNEYLAFICREVSGKIRLEQLSTSVPTNNTTYLDSVISIYNNANPLPATPAIGDRYIAMVDGNDWYKDNIYTYNGATWDETVPDAGSALIVNLPNTLVYGFSGTWRPMNITSIGKWTPFTDKIATVPLSTSTIDRASASVNFTTFLRKGYALKYTISGGTTEYFGIITALTSSLITLAGVSLGTTAINSISYSDQSNTMRQDIEINNSDWLAASKTNVLVDGYTAHPLQAPSGYLVLARGWCKTHDTGTDSTITITKGGVLNFVFGNPSFTLDSDKPTTFFNTGVTANSTNYSFDFGDNIEVNLTSAGNKDTSEAKLELFWVLK